MNIDYYLWLANAYLFFIIWLWFGLTGWAYSIVAMHIVIRQNPHDYDARWAARDCLEEGLKASTFLACTGFGMITWGVILHFQWKQRKKRGVKNP